MKSYAVRYERDETGWWVANRAGRERLSHAGAHHGGGMPANPEALGLFVKNADTAKLKDEVRLPPTAKVALGRYRSAKARLGTFGNMAEMDGSRTHPGPLRP